MKMAEIISARTATVGISTMKLKGPLLPASAQKSNRAATSKMMMMLSWHMLDKGIIISGGESS